MEEQGQKIIYKAAFEVNSYNHPIIIYYLYKISFNSLELFRISEEIDLPQLKQIHKNLDIGERLFIEKFLELETRI